MDNNKQLSIGANFSTQGISIGGKLTVTNNEIIFRQNSLNKAISSSGVQPETEINILKENIANISVQPRSFSLTDGGLRNRLRIDTKDNKLYLFVINNLSNNIIEIKRILSLDESDLKNIQPESLNSTTQNDSFVKNENETTNIKHDEKDNIVQKNIRQPNKLILILLAIHIGFAILASILSILTRSNTIASYGILAIPSMSWLIITFCIYRIYYLYTIHFIYKGKKPFNDEQLDSKSKKMNLIDMGVKVNLLSIKMFGLMIVVFIACIIIYGFTYNVLNI